jgi:hypothetical protein
MIRGSRHSCLLTGGKPSLTAIYRYKLKEEKIMKPGHISIVNADNTITHTPLGKSRHDHESEVLARAVSIHSIRKEKAKKADDAVRAQKVLREYGETGIDVIQTMPSDEYRGAQQNNAFSKVRQFLGML